MKLFSARGHKNDMEFEDDEHEEIKETAVFQIDTELIQPISDENHLAHSPSIPKPSYVGDEDDDDLNKDRMTLANIRNQRAETWQLEEEESSNKRAQYNIAITNFNHFNF